MLYIPVPASAWSEVEVNLDGLLYTIEYKFNERDNRWRMSIYYDGQPEITGIKIMENQSFVHNYKLPNLIGDIYCVATEITTKPAQFDNLGFGKTYELLYVTPEDLEFILSLDPDGET